LGNPVANGNGGSEKIANRFHSGEAHVSAIKIRIQISKIKRDPCAPYVRKKERVSKISE
jgi:hypothetical protein